MTFLLHSHLLVHLLQSYLTAHTCLGDGIGRRAGLKIRCRKAWRFESAPRHQEFFKQRLALTTKPLMK